MSQVKSPLIFVYLGDRPPGYMRSALKIACRFSNVPVRLLAPASFAGQVPRGCCHIPTEDFYEPSQAAHLLEGLRPPTQAHIKLWTYSAERFVVLESYARWAGLRRYFHAELDCIPFRLDVLEVALEATQSEGLFLPFDSPGRVVASLAYINQAHVLTEFVKWSVGKHYSTEMTLLADFAKANPDRVVALPTLEVFHNSEPFADHGLRFIDPGLIGCLVDAASLGQWIGGIDPIHLPSFKLHRNQFMNDQVPNPQRLRISRISWEKDFPVLTDPTGRSFRIHALHLHSKIHNHTLTHCTLRRLSRRANGERPRILPGAIRQICWSVPKLLLHRIVRLRRRLAKALVLIPLPWVTRSMLARSGHLRMRWEQAHPTNPLAPQSESELPPIEVLIPCIAKDAEIVSVAVVSTRTGIENPVERVVILAPIHDHPDLMPLESAGVELLADEDQKLTRTLGAVEELVPPHRRGWVQQQVLKLAYVANSTAQGVLVLDADTILLESRTWLDGQRQILAPSHEYHTPYIAHAERCLGQYGVDQGVSWVTHHQLMRPRIVRKMLAAILRRSDLLGRTVRDESLDIDAALEIWVRLGDYTNSSAISEYHTYGTYLFNVEPENVVLARWSNITFSRSEVPLNFSEISHRFQSNLSASGHSYPGGK